MILGIDPGRDKTGWALVRASGELARSGVIAGVADSSWVSDLISSTRSEADGKIAYVALGNGTTSKNAAKRIAELGVKTVLVDERGTTLLARELYWRLHRPSWWQRCLPRSMRFPSRPLDDLAAWAIALRSIEDPSFQASELGRLIRGQC